MKEGFPNQYSSKSTKDKQEHGVQIAKAILDHDTSSGEGGSVYRKARFHQNELLAMGKQGTEQYKKIIGDHKGDTGFMKMIFKEANILPPYIRKAKDIITEVKYRPVASSLDSTSISEKDAEKSSLMGNMMLKKAEEELFQDTPIKLAPKEGYVPDNSEEVEIHLETTFKSSVEIASEVAINQVLLNNDFENVVDDNAGSLLINKWTGREFFYDENGNIKFEYVPAEDIIVPNSRDKYFKNEPYKGRMRSLTVSEVRLYNEENKRFTDEEIFELAQAAENKHGNSPWNDAWDIHNHDEPWNSFTLPVLSFEYNTVIVHAWESRERKKGGIAIGKVDLEKQKVKNEVIARKRQVYYDGLYILGTDKMLKWGLRENMPFDGNGLGDSKPYSRFVIVAPELYKMVNKAIPEEAEYDIDMIHAGLFKLQQLINKMTPPKIAVDWAAIKNVVIGKGKKAGDSLDAVTLAEQIGYILFDSSKASSQHFPIQQVMEDYSGRISEIVSTINFHKSQLRENIGLNDVLAGNIENSYESFSSSKLKLNSSIKVLSPLQKGMEYLNDQSMRVLSSMIKQTIIRGDYKQIKGFEKAIGQTNVDILKIAKFDTMNEMGIKMKMLPNDRDVQRIEQNIQQDIINRELGTEDAERIIMTARESPKIAMRLAALRREATSKRRMKEAQFNSQLNEQSQQKSSMVAGEVKRQDMLLAHRLRMQELEKAGEIKGGHMLLDNMHDMDEIRLKGEYSLDEIEAAKEVNLDNTEISNSAKKQPKIFPG